MTARVSPTGRIRARIDELFASGGDLGEALEKVAQLGARLLLETALETEVTEFLGRDRYQRWAAAKEAMSGSRNGYSPVTINSTAGPVTLARPKLRGTTAAFASRLLGRGVCRTNAIESLIIAGYVRGLSTRDVEAALAEALGESASVSKSTLSRVCEASKAEFGAFRARDLSEVELCCLYLDGSHFKMHSGAGAEPVPLAWGITAEGWPVLLAIEPGSTESTDAWREFLRSVIARGLRPPTLVISEVGPGLIGAVELVWPASARQRCLIHRCGQPARQGPHPRPGPAEGRLLGHLGHRHRGGRRRCGRGPPAGQSVRGQVGQALPLGGRLPDRRPRAPRHLPALPQAALAPDPALQLHRADLRRDPPAGQSHRPAPRRAFLPEPGVGRVGPGQPRLAGRGDDPQDRPPPPTTPPRTTRPATAPGHPKTEQSTRPSQPPRDINPGTCAQLLLHQNRDATVGRCDRPVPTSGGPCPAPRSSPSPSQPPARPAPPQPPSRPMRAAPGYVRLAFAVVLGRQSPSSAAESVSSA